MTYSASALLMLLAEIHAQGEFPRELEDMAQETLDLLVNWESTSVRGSWGYPTGVLDLSNTQFVALAFWAAHRIGLKVPLDVTQRMVMATIDVHQQKPFRSPVKLTSRGRSQAGKPKIAGFCYDPNKPESVRGSMTIAGLAVQRIAREIFGRKLGRKVLKPSDASEKLALGWMEAHWSLDTNHGTDPNNQQLFYLWGIERLGALFDTDEFFSNPWYKPGAVVILGLEKDQSGRKGIGSWGLLHQTCYSLLFLSRASRAASSGKKKKSAPDSWLQDQGPVRLRVTGNMDMIAWLVDLERKDPVTKVEWRLDDEVQSTSEGDGKRPWKGERFATRWKEDGANERKVVAVVHYADGTQASSLPLKVKSTWTHAVWSERAAKDLGAGLLPENELLRMHATVKASSAQSGQHAERAADGLDGTAWIAAADDKTPRIEIDLDKPVTARSLTVSHPASSVALIGQMAGATKIRVKVNRETEWRTFDLPAQSASTMVLPLGEKMRVRSLKIEIVAAGGGAAAKRGFAEIGLRR